MATLFEKFRSAITGQNVTKQQTQANPYCAIGEHDSELRMAATLLVNDYIANVEPLIIDSDIRALREALKK